MHDLRLNAVPDEQTPTVGCLVYTVFTPHKYSIEKLPPYVYRLMTRCVISRRTTSAVFRKGASGKPLSQSCGSPVEVCDPALYSRFPHGLGYLQEDVWVEGVGDEFPTGSQGGEDLGGGQLHLGVDPARPREQGTAEDARVAQDVVDAAAVGGEGRPGRQGGVGFYLGVGVGECQDHLPLAHHRGFDQARYPRRRDDNVGLRHDGLHVGNLDTLRVGALVGERVRVRAEHPLRPGLHHQVGDTVAGRAETDLADHRILQPQSGVAAGHERRGERDDGGAVDIVVHDGLGERPYQAGLYLETLGSRDVLEVDPAERRRDAHDRLDKLVHVVGVYEDGHRRYAGELVVEDRLPLHNRHRGDGPDVAESEHPRPVRADGDAAAYHGQLACECGVLGDGLARARHPWSVDVAHVLHRPDGVGRFDHELPSLVLEERPVARPQDLHSLQFAQHDDDPLRLITVVDFQRDLPHRSLAADVYRRHVPDQTIPFRYGAGDPGQLPRAMRHFDAVRVVERHSKPPYVPALLLHSSHVPESRARIL